MKLREQVEPREPQVGDVYEDSRTGDRMELIYVDGNVYLMQDEDGNHRLGSTRELRENIESNRYSFQPDAKSFAQTGELSPQSLEEIPFEDLDNIGEKGAENLREWGYKTAGDVVSASDEDLLDVPWVGEKGVESIRKHVR